MHFPRPLYYVCDVLNIYGGKCLGPRPNLQAEGPPFIGCPVECTSSYSAHLKTFFSIPSTWPRPAGITGTHLPRSCFHYHRLAQFSKCWHILKQLTLSNLKRVFVEYTQPRVCVCVFVCVGTPWRHIYMFCQLLLSLHLCLLLSCTLFLSLISFCSSLIFILLFSVFNCTIFVQLFSISPQISSVIVRSVLHVGIIITCLGSMITLPYVKVKKPFCSPPPTRDSTINLLKPNVNYSWRTAPLTSKVAFYIFIQQI